MPSSSTSCGRASSKTVSVLPLNKPGMRVFVMTLCHASCVLLFGVESATSQWPTDQLSQGSTQYEFQNVLVCFGFAVLAAVSAVCAGGAARLLLAIGAATAWGVAYVALHGPLVLGFALAFVPVVAWLVASLVTARWLHCQPDKARKKSEPPLAGPTRA